MNASEANSSYARLIMWSVCFFVGFLLLPGGYGGPDLDHPPDAGRPPLHQQSSSSSQPVDPQNVTPRLPQSTSSPTPTSQGNSPKTKPPTDAETRAHTDPTANAELAIGSEPPDTERHTHDLPKRGEGSDLDFQCGLSGGNWPRPVEAEGETSNFFKLDWGNTEIGETSHDYDTVVEDEVDSKTSYLGTSCFQVEVVYKVGDDDGAVQFVIASEDLLLAIIQDESHWSISDLIIKDVELQQGIDEFNRALNHRRRYGKPFAAEPVDIQKIQVVPVLNYLRDERISAIQMYIRLNRDHRLFYLNLLVRPSWQKAKEDLRMAAAHGLIFYDADTDLDPVFGIEDMAWVRAITRCRPMTISEAQEEYKKMNLLVADLPDILDVPAPAGQPVPTVFDHFPWPSSFVPIHAFAQGPYTPYYCVIHQHPQFAEFIDVVYSIVRAEVIRCANDVDMTCHRDEWHRTGFGKNVEQLYDRHVYMPAWLFWNHNQEIRNPTTTHFLMKMSHDRFLEENVPMESAKYPWIIHVKCKGCFLNYIFTERSLHDLVSVNRIRRGLAYQPSGHSSNSIFEMILQEIGSVIRVVKQYSPSSPSHERHTEVNEKEFNQIMASDLLRSDSVYRALETSLKDEARYNLADLIWLVNMAVTNPTFLAY